MTKIKKKYQFHIGIGEAFFH